MEPLTETGSIYSIGLFLARNFGSEFGLGSLSFGLWSWILGLSLLTCELKDQRPKTKGQRPKTKHPRQTTPSQVKSSQNARSLHQSRSLANSPRNSRTRAGPQSSLSPRQQSFLAPHVANLVRGDPGRSTCEEITST